MKNLTLKNINIIQYGYICMAGYNITKQNPLTLHHIHPLCEGGLRVIENSAVISILAHSGIHIVSNDDLRKAQEIICYLLYYKEKPDELAAKQFSKWLQDEVTRLEYKEYTTKNNTLIYKRRNFR